MCWHRGALVQGVLLGMLAWTAIAGLGCDDTRYSASEIEVEAPQDDDPINNTSPDIPMTQPCLELDKEAGFVREAYPPGSLMEGILDGHLFYAHTDRVQGELPRLSERNLLTDTETLVFGTPGASNTIIDARDGARMWVERLDDRCSLHYGPPSDTRQPPVTIELENCDGVPRGTFGFGLQYTTQWVEPGLMAFPNGDTILLLSNGELVSPQLPAPSPMRQVVSHSLTVSGGRVAWADSDGWVHLWEASQTRSLQLPQQGLGYGPTMVMDGAVLWMDGQNAVWQWEDGQQEAQMLHEGPCYHGHAHGDMAAFVCDSGAQNALGLGMGSELWRYDGQVLESLALGQERAFMVHVYQGVVAAALYEAPDAWCTGGVPGRLVLFAPDQDAAVEVDQIGDDCGCCGRMPVPMQLRLKQDGVVWSHALDDGQEFFNAPGQLGYMPLAMECAVP